MKNYAMGKRATTEKLNHYAELSADKLQNGSKDKAILPKYAEVVIRAACNGQRLRPADVKPRKSEKIDIQLKINGEMKNVEVKCSAGAVFYAEKDGFGNALNLPGTLDDFTEDDILAGADYVVYAPDTFPAWLEDTAQVLESCFVMTRRDFINLLIACAGRGKSRYGVKIDKDRAQVTMCNMVDKKTDKKTGEVKTYTSRLDRAWNFIEEHDFPTVESWLKELGRL